MVSAATKLRYIYNKKSRAERIKMAEAFGYGGTDASKLRVVRRLAAQKKEKFPLIGTLEAFLHY